MWCLDTQIQHKAQLLKEHVLAPGKPPAVVLAHSIGSYMALQVRRRRSLCLGLVDAPLLATAHGVQRLHDRLGTRAGAASAVQPRKGLHKQQTKIVSCLRSALTQAIKQLEEERAAAGLPDTAQQIPRVCLLMPFLATDWSSRRQRLLRLAARFAHPIGAAAGALGRLPLWLLDGLVSVAEPAAEPHTRDGIKQLLNANGVRNNLHLAQHEFRYVTHLVCEGRMLARQALRAGRRRGQPLVQLWTCLRHSTPDIGCAWMCAVQGP